MMKKKILVFSIFTFIFAAAAAAAAAAILNIFSQSFWKKKKKKKTKMVQKEDDKEKKTMTTTMKKKIQEEVEEKERPNPEGGIPPPGPPDRISELPKEILCHILGFLEMDEFVIQTSLVSTQWRNLWKSVSVLKFTGCLANGSGCVLKYQNFVDHVLRLRDSQASKIEIFRYNDFIRREGYDLLERLIHNFIVNAAVNQGAQEIIIDGACLCDPSGGNNMIIHLNPSIFNSMGLLRKFTFNIYFTDFLIQFPRSLCCATQLTYLRLYRIRLPEGDDESNAQLHLVCPVLETFYMNSCYSEHLKVLDISAPRLKTLCISNSGMRRGHFDGLGGCRLEIHTPNLTSFDYSGCVFVDCFMGNLPRVTSAYLTFREETGMLEETTSFATKLLKGLTSAQSLTLEGFEVFPEDLLKELLTPFTSLKNLMLSSCKLSSIHGMVHFLNSCSSVEILIWIWEKIRTVESDEHLMLPQCRLSHLKHAHIVRLHGHKNEIEFVKFLLKNSVVLEDITIQTTADSPKQSIEKNLKQFIKEEPSLRRSIKLEILQEES